MARDGPASRALSRLDAAVARAVAGREEATFAFSGGLGSLVVAALVRKRCDLECVVVGTRGSADVEAAVVARDFLDHRLSVLRPTPSQALGTARSIAAAQPRLSLGEVLALVPLRLVEERYRPLPVFSGFGLTANGTALRRALASRSRWCPGLRLGIEGDTRAPLVRMAFAAGLPESFVRAAPRTPAEGSGIGPALRGLAHARHVSLTRFLASAGLVSDYQKRTPRPGVFKSSDVD